MIRRIVITCLGRLNGIGRCQPGRAPELRAFGSYSVALAAIISWLELGPYMACTGMGFPNVTDHGVGNRRAENLPRAVAESCSGRPLRLAAADAVQPYAPADRNDISS
jgi:hypothetical protein